MNNRIFPHLSYTCSSLLAATVVFFSASVFVQADSPDKNDDGYAVFYSTNKDNTELLAGQDFSFAEWGSGSTLNENFKSDPNYSPALQIQPGEGWGAPTATLAFNGLSAGFAEGFNSLILKIKGSEKLYIKFTDGAEPETGTEIGFDMATYGRALDGKDGWYQVNIPLTEFTSSDLYTSFAIHSGWGADTSFLITDVALSVNEVVIAEEAEVQPVPEGPDIYVFSAISRGDWVPHVGDPGWWNQPVTGEETVSQLKELAVTKTTYQNPKDALQVSWSGKGKIISQFYWQAPQPVDLTELSEKGAALALVVRIDEPPKGAVGMRMDCGYPCFGELNMSRLFKQVPEDQWFVIGVELSCFEKAGADLTKIISPLSLSTNKSFGISINTVAILESLPESQILPCSA